MKAIKNSDGWVLTWAPDHGLYFAPFGCPVIFPDDRVTAVIKRMQAVCINKDIYAVSAGILEGGE